MSFTLILFLDPVGQIGTLTHYPTIKNAHFEPTTITEGMTVYGGYTFTQKCLTNLNLKKIKPRHSEALLDEELPFRNESELSYLKLLESVLTTGNHRNDRTGTGTISKFATQLRYPLENGTLPLLTTKTVPFRLVYSELLWFLKGSTNIDYLLEHNNHIWDGNSTREFLDKQGLVDYREGELGPCYGHQWMNFGGEYIKEKDRFKVVHKNGKKYVKVRKCKKGVNQIEKVIESIKNNPTSRRHVVSAWNPSQLSEIALPPCHLLFMFYVEGDSLSCHLIMRSNDMFLGHPFNVASYATLTHMIAHLTGLHAKELVITMNDCHIYKNHVDQVKTQLKRHPLQYPKLVFNRDHTSISEFDMNSFTVDGYSSWPRISAPMAC